MRIASTVLTVVALVALASASPALEPRQPAACPGYCYFNGKVELLNHTILQYIDTPGCHTCPGHNCTGKANGDLNIGLGKFVGVYWVRR